MPTYLTGREALCIAVAGNLILFIIVMLTGFPVFHSIDDLNTGWILGNGFGAGASTCLPFLHNQHYWLSVPVRWLFDHFPGINWFSWSMILMEFASMTAIFYVLLRMQRWLVASICFLLLFMVYGSFLLVYLHNSSAAVAAIIAGILLSWFAFRIPGMHKLLIAAAIFFITGTLFRLHIAFPLMVVAAPFFLLLQGFKKKAMAAVFFGGCLLLSSGCFWLQQQHYKETCPNWQSEESYRQAKYSNINYYRNTSAPALDKYRMEIAMLDALILPDTAFVPAEALQQIAKGSRTIMPAAKFFSKETWSWTLINSRLFLIAAILGLIFCAGYGMPLISTALSFLALLAILIYLQVAMKLPEFMIPALCFIFFAFAATNSFYAYAASLRKQRIMLALALAMMAWGMVRTWKTGQHNRMNFAAFQQVQEELAAHPDKLFLSIADNDPFFYVHVFATPKKYPLRNIVFVDQPLSLRDAVLRQDFGYQGFTASMDDPHVFLRGPLPAALPELIEKRTSKKFTTGGPLPEFKFSRICKPMLVDLVIPASK